ncbi:MAG: helix-turn-helix domain-containing protein [Faecousia sp.]
MDKTRESVPERGNTTVYYHNNPGLCAYGAAFHWWDAAYTSLHDHDYYEFFIITSGRTNHLLNGEDQQLGEKTLCLIRPQDRHQFTPLQGERCIHINLPVTREKLEQLCAAVGTTLPDLLRAPSRIVLEDTDFAIFKQNAREINLLWEAGAAERLTNMIICQMLTNALVLLSKQRVDDSPGAPEWLRQVLRKIHSPEYIACQASDIYRLAGYSPPVVIRNFRQYTGETVVSYLTRTKMDWAKRLLTSTDLTILDIAGRLGYGSVSHFNKLFRDFTEMSPGEYRRYRSHLPG